MLFNSAIFIFAFFPAVLAVSLLLGRVENKDGLRLWLFVCSLFFYAWWAPAYLPLILCSMAFNYIVGAKLVEKPDKKLLTLGIAANLLLLGYFKYAGFMTGNINAVLKTDFAVPEIAMPLGISFITFLQIAFLADCHAKKISAKPRLLDFSLFSSFFPQLISGPIVRHAETMPQITRLKSAGTPEIAAGLCLFAIGLFKKVFLADSLSPFADTLFTAAQTRPLEAAEAWVAVLSYTFQIYFDFSGYSDMALGTAKMLGLRLPLNFFSPYKATSIIDFWRRWHMTLSRFLRDYLYIPLGGNRKGPARRYVNLMITMLLGGLWHGAAWTFIIWGGLHGLYLCINHLWKNAAPKIAIPAALSRALTFFAVVLAWIFFRAADTATAFSVIRSLFSPASTDFFGSFFGDARALHRNFAAQTANMALPLIVLCFVICWFLPNSVEIMRRSRPFFGAGGKFRFEKKTLTWKLNFKWGVLFGTVIGICLVKVLYEPSATFLYFRF